MTKSLTRLVSTVTLISALGLGAAFAQNAASVTGNTTAAPAVAAPALTKAETKAETKGKSAEHKVQKDHATAKAHAQKPETAKSEKKVDATGSQGAVKSDKTATGTSTATPAAAPKS
jgi:hypothetical protein